MEIDPLHDLLKNSVDIMRKKLLQNQREKIIPKIPRHGHIRISVVSKGSTAPVLVSSFCNHINSVANGSLTNENSCPSETLINILFQLNKVMFMREYYKMQLKVKVAEKKSGNMEAVIKQI